MVGEKLKIVVHVWIPFKPLNQKLRVPVSPRGPSMLFLFYFFIFRHDLKGIIHCTVTMGTGINLRPPLPFPFFS